MTVSGLWIWCCVARGQNAQTLPYWPITRSCGDFWIHDQRKADFWIDCQAVTIVALVLVAPGKTG